MMDDSVNSASKSVTMEENLIEMPLTSEKRKRSKDKYELSDTRKYDESLVGTKIKVWWHADKMYYEGVVAEYYPDRKMHKVSYTDGDVEILDLRREKWKVLVKLIVRDDEEHNTEVQSGEGSPDIHKKKNSKTDPAASQKEIKDSTKKVGCVSSSVKSKGSPPKDDKSTQKTSGKSFDAATTTSKEGAKSQEDEERLKTGSKTKTANQLKCKTPPSTTKCNTNGPTMTEKMDYDKEKEERKLHLEDERLRLETEKLRIKAEKVQNKTRQEDERLRLEAKKLELLKRESDLLIMMTDVSAMPEMRRLYFEKLQREIMTRSSYALANQL